MQNPIIRGCCKVVFFVKLALFYCTVCKLLNSLLLQIWALLECHDTRFSSVSLQYISSGAVK